MSTKTASKRNTSGDLLKRARQLLSVSPDIDATLLKLGVNERSAQARRLAAIEATNPRRVKTWKNLATRLFTFAGARPRALQRAMMFYIPDGKYQMQVFAIDDAADGTLIVCCEDVLEAAIEAGVITRVAGQPQRYTVMGTHQAILIEQQDGKTESPAAYCTAMTGWNRRALKITLPSDAADEQVQATELICAIAALRWGGLSPAPTAPTTHVPAAQ